MRWGPFWLALLLVAVIQTACVFTFKDWLRPVGLSAIDLFLALALLCGLNAPTVDARLAGWIVGFAQDLCTQSPQDRAQSPLGLQALALGLGVLLLTYLRDHFAPRTWWARLILALASGWFACLMVALYYRWFAEQTAETWLTTVGGSLLSATLAALAAIVCTELPWFLPRGRGRRRVRAGG